MVLSTKSASRSRSAKEKFRAVTGDNWDEESSWCERTLPEDETLEDEHKKKRTPAVRYMKEGLKVQLRGQEGNVFQGST